MSFTHLQLKINNKQPVKLTIVSLMFGVDDKPAWVNTLLPPDAFFRAYTAPPSAHAPHSLIVAKITNIVRHNQNKQYTLWRSTPWRKGRVRTNSPAFPAYPRPSFQAKQTVIGGAA